jgi:hypothetical protein
MPTVMRGSSELAVLAFSGLELLPAGVVLVSGWRPQAALRPAPAEANAYGVARSP